MPEGDAGRTVVVNATPMIALSIIDQLVLLQQLYGRVLIPEAVEREVLAGGSRRPGAAQLSSAPWVDVARLADPVRANLLSDLDRGEAEVIALAQERYADLVVMDERLGRRHAQRLGLPLTGTLGLLVKAKQQNLVPAIAPLIGAMRNAGIYISDGLVRKALRMSRE
ncbi:MAG: DUF3368 domain-containing protein [Acidobacteriota bacterium]